MGIMRIRRLLEREEEEKTLGAQWTTGSFVP